MEFASFGKIPRLLNHLMIITEKIDGTNAQIAIEDDGVTMHVGSRSKWITPGENDNAGFAGWVAQNREELLKLGPGRHFGEWWGQKIQRTYGLREKRFSLFNVGKWNNPESRPSCCSVVPLLYTGTFSQPKIEEVKANLLKNGSTAVPGYMDPEGIIIFLPKANMLFKSTYENDDQSKWSAN